MCWGPGEDAALEVERHVYWTLVPAGESPPALGFIPPRSWQARAQVYLSLVGSSFRVCCEKMEELDHHRDLQPLHQLWGKVSEVLFSVGSQLLNQAMNRHLKVPRNPWSQEQKGAVLSPFMPLTSFQASCICQGSTLWDVSRNLP